jgi:hypothetical protein
MVTARLWKVKLSVSMQNLFSINAHNRQSVVNCNTAYLNPYCCVNCNWHFMKLLQTSRWLRLCTLMCKSVCVCVCYGYICLCRVICNESEYRLYCMICIIQYYNMIWITFLGMVMKFLCWKGQFSSWYASRSNAGHHSI